jgi:hypothetical protein
MSVVTRRRTTSRALERRNANEKRDERARERSITRARTTAIHSFDLI